MALPTFTREALIAKYCRDYKFRNPDANTGPGSQAYFDAAQLVDLVMPIYAEANNIGAGRLTPTQLEDEAESMGLPRRLAATGANGYVIAQAAAGGATVRRGAELRHDATSTRAECLATALYQNGALIPIKCKDTGAGTNLAAGTVFKWVAPPPGLKATAIVFEDAEGNGLTGGAPEETDDGIEARVRYEKANPAVAGNAAAYVKTMQETAGVAVEAAWAFPCIQGPGGNAVLFTVRPTGPGENRIPSALTVSQVVTNLAAVFPGDDNIIATTITPQITDVTLRVRWKRSAAGWADANPWPLWSATDPVLVSAVVDALVFSVTTTASSPVPPIAGRSIALWDRAERVFRKKRILSVSGANPWEITVDTAAAASDTTFVPFVGQRVSPWADDMLDVAAALVAHFDTLGPGEQADNYFDLGGVRERRTPPSTGDLYPKDLDANAVVALQEVPSVSSADILDPPLPFEPNIGIRAVASYMLTLGELHVFPL